MGKLLFSLETRTELKPLRRLNLPKNFDIIVQPRAGVFYLYKWDNQKKDLDPIPKIVFSRIPEDLYRTAEEMCQ